MKHETTNIDTSGYNEYVQSGCWKCSQSPTHAHHWIGDNDNVFTCRYCGEVKEFQRPGTELRIAEKYKLSSKFKYDSNKLDSKLKYK